MLSITIRFVCLASFFSSIVWEKRGSRKGKNDEYSTICVEEFILKPPSNRRSLSTSTLEGFQQRERTRQKAASQRDLPPLENYSSISFYIHTHIYVYIHLCIVYIRNGEFNRSPIRTAGGNGDGGNENGLRALSSTFHQPREWFSIKAADWRKWR